MIGKISVLSVRVVMLSYVLHSYFIKKSYMLYSLLELLLSEFEAPSESIGEKS